MSITIDIPELIEKELESEWSDLNLHALEGFVTEAFRKGKLSSYQVAEILRLRDRWAVMEFLSSRGVYPGYGTDDFDRDMESLAKLSQR